MSHWTIKNVDPLVPRAHALLHCRITATDTGNGFVKYDFQTAYHQTVSSTTDNVCPIKFPKFKHRLGGNAELEWYIMVAPFADQKPLDITGTWSNDNFIPPHNHPTGDPTDSWTAQGGAGAGDDDDQGSAKSAYA